jgi:hypothetical protein
MRISDFIVTVAKNYLQYQRKDGSFQGGHNGPYYDDETPVRNSGHWLITFAKCYKLTGREIFKERAAHIAEFLSAERAKPNAYTFHHRNSERKNKCNSLIGQAWTIEALMEAYNLLDEYKYKEIAEEIFFLHPFIEKYGLWRRVEIDGTLLSTDRTFNHQLWFAACSSLISESDRIKERVLVFLENIDRNMVVLRDGLIYHKIKRLLPERYKNRNVLKLYLIEIYKKLREDYVNRNLRIEIKNKSIGYQSFNLYAFAILREQFPEHRYWKSDKLGKTISYLLTEGYLNGLKNNKYGFPYNPPGFELPYSLSILSDFDEAKKIELIKYWLNRQLEFNYNQASKMLDKNTEDALTLTARIYELARLDKKILNEDIITLSIDE